MRCLLLSLLLGVAYAAQVLEEETYLKGRQYWYRYNAQLVTGSPQSSKLTSGLRLVADLLLDFDGNHQAFARLKDVNLAKMDKFVEDHSAFVNLQPEDTLLDGIQADIRQVMISQLQKPFIFRWREGKVERVMFEPSDPQWSVNIKRGLISMFVVNLDKTYSPDKTRGNDQQSDSSDPNQPSYSVWEDSAVGYCLTTYSPSPSPLPRADKFYLTKVRHYDTCLQKAPMAYVFDNFGTRPAPEKGVGKVNHLNIQGNSDYAIKGNKRAFLVMSAGSQSKIVFLPYGPSDGSVQTSINQTVVLEQARDQVMGEGEREAKSALMRRGVLHTNLRMQLPVESAQDTQPYSLYSFRPHPDQPPKWSVDKMNQLLTYVANGTSKFPSEEVLTTMQTLMEMVRQSTNATLKQLMNQPLQQDDRLAPLKKKTLFDLLSKAGTTSASQVVVDDCTLGVRRFVSPRGHTNSCVSAITAVGLYSPPSETLVDKLIELIWHSRQQKQEQVKEAATLALGSVMGRAEDMTTDILKDLDTQVDEGKKIMRANTANDRAEELEKCMQKLNQRRQHIQQKHGQIENRALKHS
ncbi:hypothetical protein ACOMHN_054431 [Nucella lapillus]